MSEEKKNDAIDLQDSIIEAAGVMHAAAMDAGAYQILFNQMGLTKLADEMTDIGIKLRDAAHKLEKDYGMWLTHEVKAADQRTATVLKAALIGAGTYPGMKVTKEPKA